MSGGIGHLRLTISQLAEAEARLDAASRVELATMWDLSNDLLLLTDESKLILKINPRAWKIALGYVAEDLVGKATWEDLLADDELDRAMAVDTDNRTDGSTGVTAFITKMVHKNGKLVNICWSGTPYADGFALALGRVMHKDECVGCVKATCARPKP